MSENNDFKKEKLKKRIKANSFSKMVKEVIRKEVQVDAINVDQKAINHVLIVDDDVDVSETVKEIIQNSQISVKIINESTAAAKEIFENEYDLFIFDISMPNINGIRLIQLLREKKIETPVIFLSGHSDKSNLLSAIDYEASAFIEKPFDSTELNECIQRLIEYNNTIRPKNNKRKAS